jgi:hypothetical protein
MSMRPLDPNSPFALPQDGFGIGTTQFGLPAPKKKGGMFANADWGQAIQAALNGYLAAGGNPAGQMNLRQMFEERQRKQQQAMQEQQYQRERGDKRDDFVFEQDYKAQHPEDDLAQMMRSAGIDPASPAGQQMYQQAVQNKVNPFTQMRVQNPDGSETLQFMRPPTVPTAPVGKLTPFVEGGPTQPASGGFLGS